MVIKETNERIKIKETRTNQLVVMVVGLGYVGRPLADAFSRHYKVIGFDNNAQRVQSLNSSNQHGFVATSDPKQIKEADFVIIAVPTPTTKNKEPDMSYVISACRTVSQHMKHGCTVVLESTVYPGLTEELVKPILEESGRKCGVDFKLAYSPERINPGDDAHDVDKITKIVSGWDKETLKAVADLYRSVCGSVFEAKNIKTAEAAKVVENTQRDINIALVNELSKIFSSMGLETQDVLDAAASKWNFARHSPGFVGGHCIPVVPYFLAHKAKQAGIDPRIILAARTINDSMPKYVAEMAIKSLNEASKVIINSKVLIMGLTYKENVPDTREAPCIDLIKELKTWGVGLCAYDPLLNNIEAEFGVKSVTDLKKLKDIDCIILTVGHDIFRQFSLTDLKAIMSQNPIIIDIRGYFDAAKVRQNGFQYKTL
jgi:UDP-N-acetyl-D-glucosamine/UDP-N-acetyl-D-galactosamine dehydrogenase